MMEKWGADDALSRKAVFVRCALGVFAESPEKSPANIRIIEHPPWIINDFAQGDIRIIDKRPGTGNAEYGFLYCIQRARVYYLYMYFPFM